jgi:hypothetical protein
MLRWSPSDTETPGITHQIEFDSSFRGVCVATILQETAAAPCCHEGVFFPSVEFDSVRSEQREGVTSRLITADSAPVMPGRGDCTFVRVGE